jgi:ATP-dependent DNA helicase RecG
MGVVVIDEQHKFGVGQRKTLIEKGNNPDVLYMTATPIPRTLALTVYGDLDISFIKSKPTGRIPVETYWITERKRNNAYEFIKSEVDKGRQAYIVYPRIEGKEDSEIKGAVSMYEGISKQVFPELNVGLLHGRMFSEEKSKIMKAFKNGEYNVLVSTVVIEVGIDVPNASVMLIEDAQRFGLSQLHQLRGRIGRGKTASYCILVSDTDTEQGIRRLNKMVETDDGFVIAEDDLQMRGPGEFFGTRQHGLPELRFGNILKDIEIMQEARTDAFQIISVDPDLELIEHQGVKRALKARFGNFVSSE